MKYANIREEELKNKVARDYFVKFDNTKIIGNIDFCISVSDGGTQVPLFEIKAFLWAEAKKGKAEVVKSLVQLILTIGKARTFDEYLPPAFLGVFDAEKIAFIPYSEIHDIFYVNDFNWNITPSNHETKEFKLVYEKVKTTIENSSLLFTFGSDDAEIAAFIKENFVVGKSETSKIQIDKNNFIAVYNKWLKEVKPTIAVDWDVAKKSGIIDADFFLADLLAHENETLKEKLFVLLKRDHYELNRRVEKSGMFSSTTANFTDRQKSHTQFWNKYERPPREVYWDYIVTRRDLLVPQDVRERKGSFFTPQIWVELSQKYIADVIGENWQDEYYVWDCAAGTGNLLTGLTNKYNIWASTIDQQDVDVMRDRIENGANLLKEHVFQFDFLNDDFTKLPKPLHDIICDPEKRKKLVVYINPPYAEGDSRVGKGRRDVQSNRIHEKYQGELGKASGEVFAQFFMRVYCEIQGVWLAQFSTLKVLQAPNFSDFRDAFRAKLRKMFVVPADTFDNVNGQFPIGFMVWDTSQADRFKKCKTGVFDANGRRVGTKGIYSYDGTKFISALLEEPKNGFPIGHMSSTGSDFQNQNALFIDDIDKKRKAGGRHTKITSMNLVDVAVYFAVRKCIAATWLNDRDQFLYPNKKWEQDAEFQSDCLAYTLFSNNIQSQYGVNHWIPFTEKDVNARDKFGSKFMTDFIAGKWKPSGSQELVSTAAIRTTPLQFSDQATTVFVAGKALWCYYHSQKKCNVNASFYDIREHFQGRNTKGVMNKSSDDETYTTLINNLRAQLKLLAEKIATKVYEYGFLKK